MATPVTLPALGESVTEGTITRWLKEVGDEVEVDEPLLEVSTDKVDTEIPSPVAGTLQEIKVEEDETVEVGAELCIIGEGAGTSDDDGGGEEPEAEAKEEEPEPEAKEEEKPEPEPEEKDEEPEPEPGSEPEAKEEAKPKEEPQEEPQEEAKKEPAKAESSSAPSSGDGGSYVTPLVRKMAAEH